MAGNLVKRVMLKIVADDGDTEAKLDRISEKADELAAKHPDLKVKVDSAAASAKLMVLRREMKATADDANRGLHFNVSGILPAIGEMSMFQKVMLGVNVATTFAEPALAGVVVAAGGIAAGAAAALAAERDAEAAALAEQEAEPGPTSPGTGPSPASSPPPGQPPSPTLNGPEGGGTESTGF